jgi:hypothetical protein
VDTNRRAIQHPPDLTFELITDGFRVASWSILEGC